MFSAGPRERNVFEPSRSIKAKPRYKEKKTPAVMPSPSVKCTVQGTLTAVVVGTEVKKVMICYNSFKASSESIGATMEMSSNSLASSGVGIVNCGGARSGSFCRVSGSLLAVASSQRMTRMEMKPHSSLSRPI